MRTQLIRALVLSLSLSSALQAAPHTASACGDYGDWSRYAARSALSPLSHSITNRDMNTALALFTADAQASHEYNGCCLPPQWTARQWLSQRFSDRRFVFGIVADSTFSDDDRTLTVHVINGLVNNQRVDTTFTLRAENNGWKIARIYTANAARRA